MSIDITGMKNLGQIGVILGLAVTTAYVTEILGVEPTHKIKKASWFTNDQIKEILKKHIKHAKDAEMVFLAELEDEL